MFFKLSAEDGGVRLQDAAEHQLNFLSFSKEKLSPNLFSK